MINTYLLKSPLALFVLGIIIRIYFYWNKPFLSDDYWTYFWVKNEIPTIITASFADFHPPLYYIIIKGWLGIFGESLKSIRLFSLLNSFAFLVCVFYLVKSWSNKIVAKWALFLSSIAAGFIAHAQNGRMYALGMLEVILVIWSIYLYSKTGKIKYLILYGIVIILAVYTYHHFVLLLISSILFVGWHKRITKQFILAHFCILIFLLPFLYFLVPSISDLQNFHPFISNNKLKVVFLFVSAFLPGEILFLGMEMPAIQKYNYLYIFGLSIFVVLLIFQQCKKNFSTDGKLVISFSLVPVGFITLFSLFYKSVLGIQPLIFFSFPLIMSLAKVIYTKFWIRVILVLIIILTTIYYKLHLPLLATDTQPFLQVKAHTKDNDLVLVQDIYSLLWLRYFTGIQAKAIIHTQYDAKVEQALGYELIPAESIAAERVILVESALYSGIHESRTLLNSQGYTMININNFKATTVSEFIQK